MIAYVSSSTELHTSMFIIDIIDQPPFISYSTENFHNAAEGFVCEYFKPIRNSDEGLTYDAGNMKV